MRYQTILTSIALLLSTLVITAAQSDKPDFSGQWQLDPERSEGLPPGTTQLMTVKQSGDRLEVEIKVTGPQGDRTVSDVYVVNGNEAEFTPAIVGGGTPKNGKRTSTWAADARGFDSVEEATVEGDGGTDTLKGTRTWRLSEDGKLLTIDMHIEGGGGPMKAKRVFVKK